MFEPLPFYDGKLLSYKQFFFYLFFLIILCLFLVVCITDFGLNIALWYYKKNRKVFMPLTADDEDESAAPPVKRNTLDSKAGDGYFQQEDYGSEEPRNRRSEPINSSNDKMVEMNKVGPLPEDKFEEPESNIQFLDDNEPLTKHKNLSINDDGEEPFYGPEAKKSRVKALYYAILICEVLMIVTFLMFWDVMNAFGVFYAGALSLILKSVFVIVVIALGFLRFFRLFGTNMKYINPNVSWTIKGILIAVLVAGVVLYNWGVLRIVRGICIANHNRDAPGMSFGNYGITTALTRGWLEQT